MIEIRLPFPSGIHSHNTGHWRAKAGPIKAMREHACLLGRQAVAEHGAITGRVLMAYRFNVPDRRRRDTVNMMQQCKPYLDGIVDSGLIAGDHWQVCTVVRVSVSHFREFAPCVTLEFLPAEKQPEKTQVPHCTGR